MEFGYKGKLVQLVPVDIDKHLEWAYKWINNPEVTATLGFVGGPMSRATERDVLERMSKPNDTDVVFFIEGLDGRPIGVSGIHQISPVNRTAMTGSFIGDPEDWGKGYGSEAAAIRAYHAFQVLNLRMLKSTYIGENKASGRMNEKIGFKEYGRLPEAIYKNGQYMDEVFIYCTKEMWLNKTGGKLP